MHQSKMMNRDGQIHSIEAWYTAGMNVQLDMITHNFLGLLHRTFKLHILLKWHLVGMQKTLASLLPSHIRGQNAVVMSGRLLFYYSSLKGGIKV